MVTQPAASGTTSGSAPPARSGWALDALDLERLERHELAPGVAYAHIWEGEGSYAGVLYLAPHAVFAEHTHHHHAHHLWLAAGEMQMLGRGFEPGSYVFVPPRTRHGSVAGPAGATLFYVNLALQALDASGPPDVGPAG
jgi:hypothetical protein